MSGGNGRGPSFRRKFVETICSHPFLTILIAWLLVYLPLAYFIGTNFEEDRTFVEYTDENLFSSNDEQIEYYDNGTDTIMRIIIIDGDEEIRIISPEGYIPVRLELSGHGKLYTDSPYIDNRTWDLDEKLVSKIHDQGRNLTWKLEVYKKQTDAPFYKDRGDTIVEGKMLYRDVPTLNPPLINFFWIIPSLLGGTFMVFRIYFALFALFSAFLVMKIYNEEGKFRSVIYGSLILFNPLTIYSTIGAVQDDIIIAFLLIITVFSMVKKKTYLTPVIIGLGMAAKIFHILMLPGLASEKEPLINRIIKIIITAVVIVAIAAPFVFQSPDGVGTFLKLYFTGDSGDALQGISLWRYLGEIGYEPFINTALVVIAGLVLLGFTFKKEFGLFNTSILFIILFLVVFPKIHSGYYLMFLAFIPYMWKYSWWRVGLPITGALVVLLDIMNSMDLQEGPLVFLPMIVALGINIILISLFINIFKDSLKNNNTH